MKRYTSKQEYAAFYWDGSNVEEIIDWLDELGVTWRKKLNTDCHYIEISQGLCREGDWEIRIVHYDSASDNDSVQDVRFLRECTPVYVVIGKTFLSVDLWRRETFDNWFKEVEE